MTHGVYFFTIILNQVHIYSKLFKLRNHMSTITKIIKTVVNSLADSNPQTHLAIQLDITNACNLSCKHCYHSDHCNSDSLSIKNWKLILAQFKELITKLNLEPIIILSGGEPLLSPLLPGLIKHINNQFNSAHITVLSNGTVISPKILQLLSNQKISIQISLDGPTRDQHDFIRGNGSFDKTISNIAIMIENKIPVSTVTVLSKRTEDFIDDQFKLAKKLNVSSHNFTRLISQGYAKALSEKNIDSPLEPQELKTAYEKILKSSYNHLVPTNTNLPLFCLIDSSLGKHNQMGFGGIVVDYKGNLKVSSKSSFTLGNLLSENLTKLFLEHPVTKKLRLRNVEGCNKCKFQMQCGGNLNASFSKYNSFFKKDPGCWI